MGKALVRGSCSTLECRGDCVSSAFLVVSFVLSGPLSCIRESVVVQRCEAGERKRETAKRDDDLLGGYSRKISFTKHAIKPDTWSALIR